MHNLQGIIYILRPTTHFQHNFGNSSRSRTHILESQQRMKHVLVLVVAALLLVGQGDCKKEPPPPVLTRLQVRNQWNFLEYNFTQHPKLRQMMIHDGSLEPANVIPTDVDVYLDRVFLTITPWRPGVPVTLATLSDKGDQLSPLLDPYPNWHWYLHEDRCEGLVSVFRIKVDECGRLWVLDSGVLNVLGLRYQACPAKIMVFDLETNLVIRRHVFPKEVTKPLSVFSNLAVDVRHTEHGCVDTFVYISDTATYGMIVYDAYHQKSWRISAKSFWPSPHFLKFRVRGVNFFLPDGIVGLALSPKKPIQFHDRTLFYNSAASDTQNYVHTSFLQNKDNHIEKDQDSPFKTFSWLRRGQTYPLAMSSTGVLFYSELTDDSFYCWNINQTYKGMENPLIDQDHEKLQFASGIKAVMTSQAVEEIWVVTNRMQRYIKGRMDTVNKVNFRILRAPVSTLVAGTACA